MAHTPPLRTASLQAGPQFNRQSPSPPLHQPLSKRDKRRFNMEDRLAQITHEFAENRDLYYRKQLHGLQADTEYILHCNLYDSKPLDEFQGLNPDESIPSAGASTHDSVRMGGAPSSLYGTPRLDPFYKPGKYALDFVKDINDAMEQRDADLTAVAHHHNFAIDELQKDNELNVAVALQEHQRLFESLKRRLTINLNQKKATLQKEKERLDIADTNALLYNPNQFSVTNTASPGGHQSNRKTRHTRHRLEIEDMDAANGNNKRKRKAVAEAENGSPAPAGREAEPVNPLKEAAAKLEYQQSTSPLYSLDRLFTPRELDRHLQMATYDVIDNFKRRKIDSDPNLASLVEATLDSSDTEENDNPDANMNTDGPTDDTFLGAPVPMERGATNASQHATRSTRIASTNGLTTGREGLGRAAGLAAGAALIGTYSINSREKKREEDYLRAPPLSEQEQEDDMLLYKAAMADEEAGKIDEGLMDEAVEVREDYVGRGDEEWVGVDAES